VSAFSGLNDQAQENDAISESIDSEGDTSAYHAVPIGVSLSLAAAVRAHQKGKMEKAVQIYSDILRKYPDHADANYLLGVAAFDRGLKEDALAMVERAIEADPQNAAYFGKLGEILTLLGHSERANAAYEQAAELAPDDIRFHIGRAQLLERSGDIQGALQQYRYILSTWDDAPEAFYRCAAIEARLGERESARTHARHAIRLKPEYGEAHLLYGLLLLALGENEKARKHFLLASRHGKNKPELHMKAAAKLMQLQDWDGALQVLRRETKLAPQKTEGFLWMGDCLSQKGEFDGAVLSYERAIENDPMNSKAHARCGLALRSLGQIQDALQSCQKALQIQARDWEAQCAMGIVLREDDNLRDAIDHLQRAVSLAAKEVRPAMELALTYQDNQELDQALKYIDIARNLAPNDAEVSFRKGQMLLQKGQWTQGWKHYEKRCLMPAYQTVLGAGEHTAPLWDGAPIKGKRILLYAEGGFSEAIQFVRFVPRVKQRGAEVYLACQKDLARLFAAVDGLSGVIPQGTPLPRHDVCASLNSLPHLLGVQDMQDLPAFEPYLSAASREVDQWRDKLSQDAHGTTVGLVWQGERSYRKDQRRSPGIWPFSRLFYMRNIDFFSLQVGDGSDVLSDPQLSKVVRNYGIDILDFADTAALIEALDLVITCDTATGHLAGAMGKPVWMVLPYAADWRWGLPSTGEGVKSLWYPSMTLYRQSDHGDWADVFARLGLELDKFAAK